MCQFFMLCGEVGSLESDHVCIRKLGRGGLFS